MIYMFIVNIALDNVILLIIRVVPGIVPTLKALYAGHSPVKERSRYRQSVRWRLPATLCRQPGITETDG